MSGIKPFKGLLYEISSINGDHSLVCAPPYDVISPEEQDALYDKSDYNIIRLILGKICPDDNSENNRYTRAGQLIKEWIDSGVMKKDDSESFYVYVQEYEVGGVKRRRTGFMGLMKIEESGEQSVLPHEHTLAKPKEDRMNLIKQVRSNLSPIFSLFMDETGEVQKTLNSAVSGGDPILDIEIDGVRHMLWRLTDKEGQSVISEKLGKKKVFIADGHHRYAVAKNYRDIMREQPGYEGQADHILMYFADMQPDNDLTVMATHRILKKMPFNGDPEVTSHLEKYFTVTEHDDLDSLMDKLNGGIDRHIFGFYGGNKYLALELKDDVSPESLVSGDNSPEWKTLDVSILHSAILGDLLGIEDKEGNIVYTRDAGEAVEMVANGKAEGAFILNPTKVSQLKAVAENGDMMPQKSTYFYPKLLTGLVVNKFE